ncbi:MAG: hypothetical protein HY754_04350 [Nitrospirae bacterium]|nr:hypothetical protein [Nitrospirota bacterium]
MSSENVRKVISAIESERGSKLLTYVTSDRQPPLTARIALDTIPIFYKHLSKIGSTNKIDLFIFSTGGDTILPWRLVSLIREYCRNFGVLIPYKAHSAATLIALGADEIMMGTLGELSPIDPSIGTPFNPPHPDVPNEPKIEIGVEDVFGYINLAKEKLGITEQANIVKILEKLVERIHPLAIGGVYRTHALIRLLAAKLLKLHMKQKNEAQAIQQIVDDLAEKLYFHGYLIGRVEAENLGLKAKKPSTKLEQLMWELYLVYADEMGLGKPFNPMACIPEGRNSFEMEATIALIDSLNFESKFSKSLRISQLPVPQVGAPPQFGIQENIIGWKDFEIGKET